VAERLVHCSIADVSVTCSLARAERLQEWARAPGPHESGAGDRYPVLVVQRGRRGGLPTARRPVPFRENGQPSLAPDGYQVSCRAADD
jgi:hypothetical protein